MARVTARRAMGSRRRRGVWDRACEVALACVDVELIEDGPDDGWIIDDRDDAEAPAASRALEDVGVEGAAHERSPVDARRGGDERAGLQALPMAYRQDVRREQASES
jgi:hypothetical protein